MLSLLILLIIVTACIFLILFYELKEANRKASNSIERINHLEKKLFGCQPFDDLFSVISAGCFVRGRGIFEALRDRNNENNGYFKDRIKALENYLKVEYIDEKKIVNGREEDTFKGYRHKAKK